MPKGFETQKTMTAAFAPYAHHQHSDIITTMSTPFPMGETGPDAPALEKIPMSPDRSPPYPPSSGVLHEEQHSLSHAISPNNSLPGTSPAMGVVLPPDSAKRFICLCTPKPKIPRPRNGESLRGSRSLVFACSSGSAGPSIILPILNAVFVSFLSFPFLP